MAVIAKIVDNKIIIEADLDGNTSSKSGKSIVKVSTGGFQSVDKYQYSLNVISKK